MRSPSSCSRHSTNIQDRPIIHHTMCFVSATQTWLLFSVRVCVCVVSPLTLADVMTVKLKLPALMRIIQMSFLFGLSLFQYRNLTHKGLYTTSNNPPRVILEDNFQPTRLTYANTFENKAVLSHFESYSANTLACKHLLSRTEECKPSYHRWCQ